MYKPGACDSMCFLYSFERRIHVSSLQSSSLPPPRYQPLFHIWILTKPRVKTGLTKPKATKSCGLGADLQNKHRPIKALSPSWNTYLHLPRAPPYPTSGRTLGRDIRNLIPLSKSRTSGQQMRIETGPVSDRAVSWNHFVVKSHSKI